MAKKAQRSRWRNPSFILLFVISAMLIFVYVVSLFADPSTTLTTVATPEISTPIPTAFITPTIDPAGPQLLMGQPTVQANGFFQITVPEGYFTSRSDYDGNLARARTTFSEPNRLSILEALLQQGVNYPSLQAVSDDVMNNDFFFREWGEYDAFTETGRTVEERLTVNFNLLSNQVEYLGRQVAWLDGDWLYILRYVVPANNPNLLEQLDELVTPTFIGFQDQRGGITTYSAYADHQLGFMVRHPGWQQVSGTVGSPAVFEDPSTRARLFLRRADNAPLPSIEAAQSYVTETLRPGATLKSSQVTTREYGAGFLVSYSDRDNEGNPISGVVALLAPTNTSHVVIADVRLPVADIDMLSLDEGSPYQTLRAVLDTFMVLPSASVAPTLSDAVVTTATPEITSEATGEATVEATAAP